MKTGRKRVIDALDLARKGDVSRAKMDLHEMRSAPNLEADAYYGLGLIELCQNNTKNAHGYFCKATQSDAAHADAYYQLAKIADSQGDAVTAVLYLKSAIAQDSGHIMATEALEEHGVFIASS
ncbi:MAG: hypothetical protein K0U72_02955 [Gammaproteobacteria bacterium]|nr:hypothetical protein [Gammaproteobacteria bacterium]